MTQKSKNIAITFGFLVLVFLAYKFAINNTFQLKSEEEKLKNEALVFNNMPVKLSSLKQKEKYFDSLLIKYKLNGSSIQNSMLNSINSIAETQNIKVVDFIKPHKTIINSLTINTYQFTLEGSYNALLAVIYQFEQHTKYGEIINLNFKKQKNYRTGKYYLQARVLLKSFG